MVQYCDWIRRKCAAAAFHGSRLTSFIGASLVQFVLSLLLWWTFGRPIRKPQVVTGLTFGTLGGFKNHLVAISKHSRHRVAILPSGFALRLIEKYHRHRRFQNQIQAWMKAPVLHSHVEPEFIDECHDISSTKGTAWIHTYHTLYFPEDWELGLDDWKRAANDRMIRVASKADVRISVSRWLQKHLLEEHGIESHYIPNGIDSQLCDGASSERFVRKFGLSEFVLFSGGLADIKNPLEFFRLARVLPQMQFLMVGRGMTRDVLIEKTGVLPPSNLALIGALPRLEMLDCVAACRVFVMTSRSEGLPTAMMEAMLLQRSVVGCDRFGVKEVIGDDSCGYVYEFGNINDLARKTQEAFTDNQKGRAARMRVLRHYSWNVVIPEIDKLYADALILTSRRAKLYNDTFAG